MFSIDCFTYVQTIFANAANSCCSFVNSAILLFSNCIFIVCSLKDSQNVFMRYSPLYTSCLFSIPSDVHVIDIEFVHLL